MEISNNIIQQIRWSLFAGFLKAMAILGVFAAIGVWTSGNWSLLFVFLALLIGIVVQIYLGTYIPLLNKHDSLLNKHGAIYLDEANKAIARFGIEKLISTQWFETYADDLCRNNPLSESSRPVDMVTV
ncbi:MAG: hypothetical protein GXP15_09825 [Gammaproteobacteria bacterium]|nr:hypothetical protein [Gammaproteobacteria bacterium]